jgi:hypothetical protein
MSSHGPEERLSNLSTTRPRPLRASSLFLTLLALAGNALGASFTPARSSDDLHNPHKGFMHWGTTFAADGGVTDHYGSRIFHVYAPWREIETADQVFDWAGFEQHHLNPISAVYPDATFVLRLVADYPDSAGSGIDTYYSGGQNERDYPLFLEQAPLNIPATNYASCDGDGPGRAPDWNHANLKPQLEQLIDALDARYDGDPRITAIQVGLLGLWGEWHQSGCPALEPGATVKQAVRDRYAAMVTVTPLQTRYSRATDVGNTEFAFHEDYFPSFTGACNQFPTPMPLCSDDGDWNLEWAFAHQSPGARDNWQSNPVSGESPLAAQKNVWVTRQADIETLIRTYHLSFLGPAGKHEEAGFASALVPIRRTLGYNLHLDLVDFPASLSAGSFGASATLFNSGSAPPYHDFALRLELVDAGGVSRWSGSFAQDPRDSLPNTAFNLSHSFTLPADVPDGSYSLRASLPALASGRPPIVLQSTPRDANGRVILGTITVLASGNLFANGFE